jgi:rhodanese-related sulfurtransferase
LSPKLTGLLMSVALVAGCMTIGVSREEGGFGLIAPTIAHEMIVDNEQVVILDFRPEDQYHQPPGHIAGAISVPLDTIETRLPELIPYSRTTVIVYGSTRADSEKGARILGAAGFRNVVVMQGGLQRWIDLGYKTVTSG